ncbi:XRE family transcriptional regulator [Psychrobacter aestuarii]|uniref:ImmA/IrrE family metallo-endopeptidase n=1 Tax=Psychrobacter aestuarii TaxID=556327 RepID=A0ABN0W163_9GAMM|nr:XRE family transcriptional regulator [Psychrobacter aestuarii]
MASRQLVTHSPNALKHYRQQMSLSVDLLAKKTSIKAAKIEDAEANNRVFTIKQLNKIAEKLLVPVSYLTFDSVIHRDLPEVVDFRNKIEEVSEGDEEQQYQFNKVVQEAYIDRDNLLGIYESLNDVPNNFSLELSGCNAKQDANLITEFLQLKDESLLESNSDYYKSWRTIVEKNDVLVLEKSNPHLSSEGMALYYEKLPIIVILTTGQPPARRLFTLIHELVHLGLKQSVLDGSLINSSYDEEIYCNKVAGYVLVPESVVQKCYSHSATLTENVLNIRKITKASRQAVAIQLKQLDLIQQNELEDYLNSLRVEISGNFGVKKRYSTYNHFGKVYLQQVFSAIWQEELTINTAMDLLRIPNRIEDLKYLEEKAFS